MSDSAALPDSSMGAPATAHGRDAERCPACGSSAYVELRTGTAPSLARCNGCDLVFSHPQPRARVLEKYLEEYDLAEHFGDWSARKKILFERRLDRLSPPEPGRDRLCDVGCGDGQFLELARDRGWRVSGVELNPPAAERARQRGVRVYGGLLETRSDLPWGTFDVVTGWDVLEHTPDPATFASAMIRLARPDGEIVLTTLHGGSWAWRVFRGRWSMVVDDHFTYWNARSLTGLFSRLGAEPEALWYFGLGRDFVSWLDGVPFRRSSAPALAAQRGPARGRRWDVHPAVLGVETRLNRLLDRSSGGVGIGLRLRVRRDSGPERAARRSTPTDRQGPSVVGM